MSRKPCSKCKIAKLLLDFGKRKTSKDGRKSACKVCLNSAKKVYYQKNKEAYLKTCRDYRTKNSAEVAEKRKVYDEKNREHIKGRYTRYYGENKQKIANRASLFRDNNKELFVERGRRWRKNNPGLVRANTAKYRASKLQRTPAWANFNEIAEFYKNCPQGYHVDHIIPLQGKLVSGLHVLSNLQYLTAEENLRKSNKFQGVI